MKKQMFMFNFNVYSRVRAVQKGSIFQPNIGKGSLDTLLYIAAATSVTIIFDNIPVTRIHAARILAASNPLTTGLLDSSWGPGRSGIGISASISASSITCSLNGPRQPLFTTVHPSFSITL